MIKTFNIISHCLALGGLSRPRALVLLLCGTLCAVILALPKPAMAERFEILTPQPGATIIARNAETHLVLRQALSGKSNIVRVRKSGLVIKPVILSEGDEYEYVHFVLPLERGKNNFTIEPDGPQLSLIHISEPTRLRRKSRMPSSA